MLSQSCVKPLLTHTFSALPIHFNGLYMSTIQLDLRFIRQGRQHHQLIIASHRIRFTAVETIYLWRPCQKSRQAQRITIEAYHTWTVPRLRRELKEQYDIVPESWLKKFGLVSLLKLATKEDPTTASPATRAHTSRSRSATGVREHSVPCNPSGFSSHSSFPRHE